jgi:PHP family Zn ribbon phosphoesterase
MSDSPDYKVDIKGLKTPAPASGRPYLSVLFACCSVYQRIYRNEEATAYVGRCPRCGKPIRFEIGPGGTSERNFVVY